MKYKLIEMDESIVIKLRDDNTIWWSRNKPIKCWYRLEYDNILAPERKE